MDAGLVAPAQLGRDRIAAQHRVDRVGDVGVDRHPVAILDLHHDVERGRRLALEDALLRAAAARLLVAERHGLDAADEVGQRRVEHQVVEAVAVRRADELDAALGDRARGRRLELRPDLVDDDDLGHVVLDRLDHHRVLERRRAHLHPPRAADARMRDVAVAGDLVGGVDDHDALVQVVGQDARRLAQHGRLADARPAHDQHRLARLDEVLDDLDRAEDGAADAAGQADDLAVAVADGGDAVERPLDAGAVVVAERADVVDDVLDVLFGDLALEQLGLAAAAEARLRRAAEVHHDLDHVRALGSARKLRWISGGSASSRASMSSVSSTCGSRRPVSRRSPAGSSSSSGSYRLTYHDCLPGQRTAGTSIGSATRTRVSFNSSDTWATGWKPASSSRRSSGDS